jgi:cyclohexa-1,5-dienecarbonyl-CoA hydratase
VSGLVRVSKLGAAVRLSLARPPLNVLDRPLNRALAEALRTHGADRNVAAIVIDGGESNGFSAGVEVADHTPDRVAGMLEDFHGAIRALWDTPCPTLAAIHGFALGGGLELAISCDLAVTTMDAKLGFPEIRLGCYPPVAAALLPSRVGWAVASELVLAGDEIEPERAMALGLVNRICAHDSLAATRDVLLRPLLRKSPAVLREAKRALREGTGHAAHAALERIERRYLDDLMKLEDANEGIRAFMERRNPAFTNR